MYRDERGGLKIKLEPSRSLNTTQSKSAYLKGPMKRSESRTPLSTLGLLGTHTDDGCFGTALELERITNQVTVDHIIGGVNST